MNPETMQKMQHQFDDLALDASGENIGTPDAMDHPTFHVLLGDTCILKVSHHGP